MASYEYKYFTSNQVSDKRAYHFARMKTKNDIDSAAKSNIPKYATITACRAECGGYRNGLFDGGTWNAVLHIQNSNSSSNTSEGNYVSEYKKEEAISKSNQSWSWNLNAESRTANSGCLTNDPDGNAYVGIRFYFSTAAYYQFTMTKGLIHWDYTPATFTLTVNSNGNGSVTGGKTVDRLKTNNTITFSATPNTGYHFVRWSDGSTSASRTFTINDETVKEGSVTRYTFDNFTFNCTLTAYFEVNSYEITGTVNPTNSGSISNLGTHNHFENISLLATPAAGWEFRYWGDGTSTNPLTFQVTGPRAVTAIFHKLPEIYVGNDRIKAIYIGQQLAKEMYIGNDQVIWE